jgi:hypothetical protein
MKGLLIISLCGVWLAAIGQPANHRAPFRPGETITGDLNHDGKPDTVRISSNLTEKDYFNKISVTLAGYKKQTFYAKDKWTTVDKEFLRSNKNAVPTRLLFLKKTPKHAVILLFGVLDDAGYREEFSIVNIENNTVKMVLRGDDQHTDVEIPETLSELNRDERLCFVYRDYGERIKETPKGSIGTYNPFAVYPVDDSCIVNDELTKKYNQEHYIYPDGKYSGEILIFYPRNGGKPSVYKGKDLKP